MLFLVIERFRDGDPGPVGERFEKLGRILPEGVAYHSSWMDVTGTRCFQLMEAERQESLEEWVRCWQDLVEFEIAPVVPSAEFWAKRRSR
jgi:hypothetical protein